MYSRHVADECRFLLEPARWVPRLYGDWRNEVPVGALVFHAQDVQPGEEMVRAAEFLKISVDELLARHGRGSDAVQRSFSRHLTHLPPEAAVSSDEPLGELFGRLFGEVADEYGSQRTSSKTLSWRTRRKGVTGSLSFRWSVAEMNTTKQESVWGLYGGFRVKPASRAPLWNEVGRCQDAPITSIRLSPGRVELTARDCTLVGDIAVDATVRCVRNALECVSFLCDVDQFNAVEDALRRSAEFWRDSRSAIRR